MKEDCSTKLKLPLLIEAKRIQQHQVEMCWMRRCRSWWNSIVPSTHSSWQLEAFVIAWVGLLYSTSFNRNVCHINPGSSFNWKPEPLADDSPDIAASVATGIFMSSSQAIQMERPGNDWPFRGLHYTPISRIYRTFKISLLWTNRQGNNTKIKLFWELSKIWFLSSFYSKIS